MVNKIIFVTKMRVKETSFIQQLIDTILVYTRNYMYQFYCSIENAITFTHSVNAFNLHWSHFTYCTHCKTTFAPSCIQFAFKQSKDWIF